MEESIAKNGLVAKKFILNNLPLSKVGWTGDAEVNFG